MGASPLGPARQPQPVKMRQVMEERRTVVNELTYSYRLLFQIARQQGADSGIDSRDLGLLGRRLYAAFERKAGKVENINPGIAPDLGEDVLTLVQLPADDDRGRDGSTCSRTASCGANWNVMARATCSKSISCRGAASVRTSVRP